MSPKRKYLAPKGRDAEKEEEFYNMSKNFIESYLPYPEKTTFLNKLEVHRLIAEGIPPLEQKVELLASKEEKLEALTKINYELTFVHFENAIELDPTDSELKRIIVLANEIVRENKDKKRALKALNKIREIRANILREMSEYIRSELRRGVRKDDYKKGVERMMIEDRQVRAKMEGMIDKHLKILQAIVKNDAEYKKLLERKKSGEQVEDLITKNRAYHEKLKKERKESSEIALKWGRSEEGRKMFAKIDMWARINPNIARMFRNKHELELQMDTLNDKIQKNEEEYENLLERKNNGEYVDDLITKNRYTAENLKQSKKNCEKALNKLKTEKNSDWKSKIER